MSLLVFAIFLFAGSFNLLDMHLDESLGRGSGLVS